MSHGIGRYLGRLRFQLHEAARCQRLQHDVERLFTGLDAWLVENEINGLGCSMNDIDDTRREAGFLCELAGPAQQALAPSLDGRIRVRSGRVLERDGR